eukprot:587935-Rhodomonas_salina.4
MRISTESDCLRIHCAMSGTDTSYDATRRSVIDAYTDSFSSIAPMLSLSDEVPYRPTRALRDARY